MLVYASEDLGEGRPWFSSAWVLRCISSVKAPRKDEGSFSTVFEFPEHLAADFAIRLCPCSDGLVDDGVVIRDCLWVTGEKPYQE